MRGAPAWLEQVLDGARVVSQDDAIAYAKTMPILLDHAAAREPIDPVVGGLLSCPHGEIRAFRDEDAEQLVDPADDLRARGLRPHHGGDERRRQNFVQTSDLVVHATRERDEIAPRVGSNSDKRIGVPNVTNARDW